jgi:AcrR family transcriptional regulator
MTQSEQGPQSESSKQTTKSEKRRHQILEAAVQQIMADGMTDFGLRRVAARAGIGLSSLQHHYATLTDLLDAVMGHIIAKERDILTPETQSAKSDPQSAFADTISQLVNGWTSPGRAACLPLVWAEAQRNSAIAEKLDEFHADQRRQLVELLRPCHPHLTYGQLDQIARFVMAGSDGHAASGNRDLTAEANPDLAARNLVTATRLLAESFNPISGPGRFV